MLEPILRIPMLTNFEERLQFGFQTQVNFTCVQIRATQFCAIPHNSTKCCAAMPHNFAQCYAIAINSPHAIPPHAIPPHAIPPNGIPIRNYCSLK